MSAWRAAHLFLPVWDKHMGTLGHNAKKIILIVVLQTSKTPQHLLKLLAEGLPLPLEEKPTSLYRQMRTTSIHSIT